MKQIKKFEYTPILGWSVSRYDKFLFCKRQYFYDYYAKYDSEYQLEKITRLKKMTSIPLEVGNIVHDIFKDVLERLLKSERDIDRDKFFKFAARKTEEYISSKVFAEVYYKEIKSVDIGAVYRQMESALDNFFKSNRFLWLTKEVIINKKEWIIEPKGFGETRIDGMKAYCKVDFLFPMDGKIYILDWKTGRANEKKHSRQLIGYSAWASYHFDKDPTEIIPIIVYLLPEYREAGVKNEFNIDSFAIQVKRESEDMYAMCKDVEYNIPKEKEEFKKTENSRICRFCNYRELCR